MLNHDQNPRVDMLVRIAALLTELDLDWVLENILRVTTETVGATQGSFFLIHEDGQSLQRFISARPLDPQLKSTVSRTVLEHGLAGWVGTHRQSALVHDTLTDERWLRLDNDSEPSRVRSAICVPFFIRNELRGIITLEHPQPSYFTEIDLQLVEAAANQTSTALRNAQLFDRVQSQQRELEAVLNSITDVLLVVDKNWHLRLYNPAALTLLGGDAQLVSQRSLDDLSRLTGTPLFARLVHEIQTDGSPAQSFELHEEGTSRDFVVSVAALNTQGSQGYVIAMHEVTSLKDLNGLKTHMIQMASHDLKNPIGVLRGYLDVIRTDAGKGVMPDVAFLDGMQKSIMRMETLVANLLDIQRAENDSPLERERIDPNELLQAVLDDMQPSAYQKGHRLEYRSDEPMRPVKGDFVRLREVMNNLVENAIKYTPDGGTITITAFTQDERFVFQVKDTGYGIPRDKHPFIFQPYFRAQTAGTEHIPGTGIGLSLVKEIVERHGGHVWFSSTEAQGSIFGFWLPILS